MIECRKDESYADAKPSKSNPKEKPFKLRNENISSVAGAGKTDQNAPKPNRLAQFSIDPSSLSKLAGFDKKPTPGGGMGRGGAGTGVGAGGVTALPGGNSMAMPGQMRRIEREAPGRAQVFGTPRLVASSRMQNMN
jgi:hypothetical protein